MKAYAKAAIQACFGRLPGGAGLYRKLTRERMGTQASHIEKLARAWPRYVETWHRCGLDLEGKVVWMHEGGWTPYPFMLLYLLTGRGGIVTMTEGEPQDRYAEKALEFALRQRFGSFVPPEERYETLRALQGCPVDRIVQALGGRWLRSDRLRPHLEPASVDLLVTGGVLEHLRPDELRTFLAHSRTIVREGGWASHVFDLRDHLYHADKSIPFLNHLRFSDPVYGAMFGHRLGYHSRLFAAQIREEIEGAGFRVTEMRRRVLPADKYVDSPEEFDTALVGLERRLLDPKFRGATDEDLRTVAAQFICRG